MISPAVLDVIGRTVQARHAAAWDALREDTAAAKAARWPDGVLPLVERVEALARLQADATVAAVRPLLATAAVTPAARHVVRESLDRVHETIVSHLLAGMSVARAKEIIAEGEALDAAVADDFLAALETTDE